MASTFTSLSLSPFGAGQVACLVAAVKMIIWAGPEPVFIQFPLGASGAKCQRFLDPACTKSVPGYASF